MSEVLFDTYIYYHYLITDFYEKNKTRIKSTYIDSTALQLEKEELEFLSSLKKQKSIKR